VTLPIGWLSAFSLTLGVEAAVGAALGFRRPRELAAIAAANLVSHPGFYALALRCAVSWGTQAYLVRLPLLEGGVAVLETALLKYALPRRTWPEVAAVSVLANAASCVAGLSLLY